MDQERYAETRNQSFYGDYLYDMVVPQHHFFRKLRDLIDWSCFTKKLIKLVKKYLTNPRKRTTIRISINYCCVPGKCEPLFVGLADLQSPPHKRHGFRILTHNPEVSGSNPLPATNGNAERHYPL